MDRLTSAKNPVIKGLKTLNQRKGRMNQGRFLVEGQKMILEALSCGLTIREALVEEGQEDFAFELEEKGARAFIVPRELLATVCDTVTPQGVCASFDIPSPMSLENAPRLIAALDGVQDPGNLGTIWRTADAAGFGALLLGAGCVDPLSPKVQRAAMGSGFRVPFMVTEDLPLSLFELRQKGYCAVISDLQGENFYHRPDPGDRFILVIGNEARGISDATRAQADIRVRLPMRGGAESLNAAVAAGILMYGLTENL